MKIFDHQSLPNKFGKKELKKKSDNMSDWYTDVVLKAELADYGPVRGTMIVRPYGYAIWEFIQDAMDARMKAYGVQNASFPMFIPYSFLQKEKKHVEGFSPELALVTVGGGEELKEPLVVRPTSETIIYDSYAKWISSWRDLPVMMNLWNSVVRWEKRTFLFLRSMEFLWHEAHTAHEDEEGAVKMCLDAQEWYRQMYEDYFAIPVVAGTKSDSETFAGAKRTYTVECLLPDGRALQGATSHNLAQNFSKVFDVKFQDREGKTRYVWQTSYAITTRAVGALLMMHGDDNGLIIPPNIAPIQIVVIPIPGSKKETYEYAQMVFRVIGQIDALAWQRIKHVDELVKFKTFRVELDDKEGETAGVKFNKWELKGVPLRIEIGNKEVEKGEVTIVRRDTGEKITGKKEDLLPKIQDYLDQIQRNLFEKAKKFLDENTHEVETYDEFKKVMETKRGFLKAFWCEDPVCEAKIKEETKATTRCKPLEAKEESGKCIYCGKPAKYKWYFAQAY